MLDLALRDLTGHKLRTLLTAIGIIIAITAIVSLGSISTGINELITSTTGSIGSDTIFVMKRFDFSQMSGPPSSMQLEDIGSEVVEDVKSVPNAKRVVPIISRNMGGLFEVDGIDMNDVDLFGGENLKFKEGTWPENNEKGAALGYVVANVMAVSVGDYIELNKKDVEVMGIFEEGSGSYDLVILIPYDYADDIYEADGGATQIMIEPQDVSVADEIKHSIEDSYDDLDAMTMKDAMAMAKEATSTLDVMTFGIGFVSSLVAAIGIIITMYTSVVERRRQIGIMKAVGALRSTILKQILEEALIVSVVSSLIGVALSFYFVGVINDVMLGGTNIAVITPQLAIGAVAYGIILSLIAGFYPAWVATKIDPVKTMREG
jgi:putative ABC transport system permease protein